MISDIVYTNATIKQQNKTIFHIWLTLCHLLVEDQKFQRLRVPTDSEESDTSTSDTWTMIRSINSLSKSKYPSFYSEGSGPRPCVLPVWFGERSFVFPREWDAVLSCPELWTTLAHHIHTHPTELYRLIIGQVEWTRNKIKRQTPGRNSRVT